MFNDSLRTPSILALLLLLLSATCALGQPVILTQPQSLTNALGTTATFWVTATGTEPLAYQWQKLSGNWSDLAGCTDTNLALGSVQTSHSGDYRVVVTNIQSAVTSEVARLTVIVPPAITSQPKDRAVALGAAASFSVLTTGTSPFNYHWLHQGADLLGATSQSLSIPSAQFTNAGAYTVVVANQAGAVTSSVAMLSVAEGWIYTNAQGTRLPYRLFLPPQYDPGTRHPLVLFWHGGGEVGTDNVGQLKDNGQFSFLTASNLAKFPCFYLAPQVASANSCEEFYGILDCATNLLSHLEAVFSIDPDRVYVTGLSAGGHGTWIMVARYPDLFAAAVPMSGRWPCNSIQDFLRSLHVPVWNFHGANDGTIGVGYSDAAVAALRSAGASVTYTR
jgi:predicted esterase